MQAEPTASGLLDCKTIFPEKSIWCFLTTSFSWEDRRTRAGMLRTALPIRSTEDQVKLSEFIHGADPQAIITGWQYTLWDLIPWAKGELVTFTTVVGLLILLLVWVVYRRLCLCLIHPSALF